jgi:hypothetical protein
LEIPDEWFDDDFCRARYPRAFPPVPAVHAELIVSCSSRVLGDTVSEDIETDMASGARIQEAPKGTHFIVQSSSYTLYVHSEEGDAPGEARVVVTRIDVALVRRRRALPIPLKLKIVSIYKKAPSDLNRVARLIGAAESQMKRRDRLRLLASDEFMASTTHRIDGPDLRTEVGRTYRPLLALLNVLRTRVLAPGELSETASIVDVTSTRMALQLPPGSVTFQPRTPIKVSAGDHSYTRRIVDIEERPGGLRLIVEPSASLSVGSDVTVTQVSRFSMLANIRAIERLTDLDVEGDWRHLATLMTRPGRLPVFPVLPPASFFLESGGDTFRFDDDQKAAIAGAISTPHAFFIKGPPGTGKTSVIAETVLQLVARGERVLLVAPMHVALDEVLARVQGRPGVFPMRLSWAESMVRSELQRYLPESVASTYLKQARRPETSQGPAWRRELTDVAARLDAVRRYVAARQAVGGCRRTLRDSGQRLQESHAAYQSIVARLTVALATRAHDYTDLGEQIASCEAEVSVRQAELESFPSFAASGWGIAYLEGEGAIKKKIRILENSINAKTAARESLLALVSELDRELFVLAIAEGDRRIAFGRQLAAAKQELEPALREVAEARRLVADMYGQDPNARPMTSWLHAASDLDEKHHRLTQLILLEQRWFQLSGLEDTSSQDNILTHLATHLRQAANVVCTTTMGAAGPPLHDADFDTLIVDEASRVLDSEFLIGAIKARRWLLVGDENQLPPHVNTDDEQHLYALAAHRMVDQGRCPTLEAAVDQLSQFWQLAPEPYVLRREAVLATVVALRETPQWPKHRSAYREAARFGGKRSAASEQHVLRMMRRHLFRSLFEHVVADAPAALISSLTMQYRMIEPIASLVNEPVYCGRYRSPSAEVMKDIGIDPLISDAYGVPVVFLNTQVMKHRAAQTSDGTGFINELEAQWAVAACKSLAASLTSHGDTGLSVSILTFYKKQAQLIERKIAKLRSGPLGALTFDRINVIDSIQGQQSDVVILSFCRAIPGRRPRNGSGLWLQDVRRLNVALTRARRGLILIGHRPTLLGLRGLPAAEGLYRHIFASLDTRAEMKIIESV